MLIMAIVLSLMILSAPLGWTKVVALLLRLTLIVKGPQVSVVSRWFSWLCRWKRRLTTKWPARLRLGVRCMSSVSGEVFLVLKVTTRLDRTVVFVSALLMRMFLVPWAWTSPVIGALLSSAESWSRPLLARKTFEVCLTCLR